MRRAALQACLFLLLLPLSLEAVSDRELRKAEQAWTRASGWILAQRRASGNWSAELDPGLSGMVGREEGEFTTTLGSLHSKQCAAQPEWCRVVGLLLDSLGIDERDTVAVTMTGSFAGINLAVLLVLEEAGIPYRCVSSLGASSHGANSVDYNWPLVESWLKERRLLVQGSSLVTPGGSGDRLSTSTLESLAAAEETLRGIPESMHPGSLRQAVELREHVLGPPEHISLLINVGGGHAVLGSTGFGRRAGSGLLGDQARRTLAEEESQTGIKGLMQRWFELGMPVLHFSDIPHLAMTFKLPCDLVDSLQVTTEVEQ